MASLRSPGDGAAGRLPLRHHHRRQRPLRAAATRPTTRCAWPSPSSASTDWIDTLADGLDTKVGERGEHLSAGERQLVALARAYVANPSCLVLDEATAPSTPPPRRALARALESLARGRTSVTIAHRLSTAARADCVLVFRPAGWSSRATTTSCCAPTASTPACTPAGWTPRRWPLLTSVAAVRRVLVGLGLGLVLGHGGV